MRIRAYIYLLLEKWYGRGGDGVRVRVKKGIVQYGMGRVRIGDGVMGNTGLGRVTSTILNTGLLRVAQNLQEK